MITLGKIAHVRKSVRKVLAGNRRLTTQEVQLRLFKRGIGHVDGRSISGLRKLSKRS